MASYADTEKCPACLAQPGEPCRGLDTGRRLKRSHTERGTRRRFAEMLASASAPRTCSRHGIAGCAACSGE
jgi:hypothetical protein